MQLGKLSFLPLGMLLSTCVWGQGPGLPISSGDMVHIQMPIRPRWKQLPE